MTLLTTKVFPHKKKKIERTHPFFFKKKQLIKTDAGHSTTHGEDLEYLYSTDRQ